MKGHVLHRARAHLKVPGCSLVLNALLTKKLPMFLSRLIEINGGCEKILAAPPPGLLPPERTEGSSPFEVVGVDFAGPIKYRKSSRAEGKAYLALYACSLTRALEKTLT